MKPQGAELGGTCRRREQPNSEVEADVALGRCAPSGPRSLTPVVGRTREVVARFKAFQQSERASGGANPGKFDHRADGSVLAPRPAGERRVWGALSTGWRRSERDGAGRSTQSCRGHGMGSWRAKGVVPHRLCRLAASRRRSSPAASQRTEVFGRCLLRAPRRLLGPCLLPAWFRRGPQRGGKIVSQRPAGCGEAKRLWLAVCSRWASFAGWCIAGARRAEVMARWSCCWLTPFRLR
jgi:hypothetical protein